MNNNNFYFDCRQLKEYTRNRIINKNTYNSDTQRKPPATQATVTIVGFYHSNCQSAMVMKPVGIPSCICFC